MQGAALEKTMNNIQLNLEKTMNNIQLNIDDAAPESASPEILATFERKRSISMLRKITRAVEQSPVTIMITDTHGNIEFVNPKFTEMTGYCPQVAIGQNPRILKSGRTPPETHKNLWSTITSGKTWEGEFVNKREDGNLFYEHAKISPLRDDNGTIIHYLAVKEDITEKKNIMEQLMHSQKLETIGQLAGGLAHDLNNILSVVNGYATLALLEMDKDMAQFEFINQITIASSRAAAITRSLLTYSRKQETNLENLNLNDLIRSFGTFIKRTIRDDITFSLSLSDDTLCVSADTVQIGSSSRYRI